MEISLAEIHQEYRANLLYDSIFYFRISSKYILVEATQDPINRLVKLRIMNSNEIDIHNGYEYRLGTTATLVSKIYIQRDATDARPLTYLKVNMKRLQNYIYMTGGPREGEKIYQYDIEQPFVVLPPPAYRIHQSRDTLFEYSFHHIHLCQVPPPTPPTPLVTPAPSVTPAVPAPSIPNHVIRAFMDAAIEKKEECPITMEPFTKASIVYTPCGHLFTRDALSQALATAPKCPTCRTPITQSHIINYSS